MPLLPRTPTLGSGRSERLRCEAPRLQARPEVVCSRAQSSAEVCVEGLRAVGFIHGGNRRVGDVDLAIREPMRCMC